MDRDHVNRWRLPAIAGVLVGGISLGLFAVHGLNYGGDFKRYIDCGQRLADGLPLVEKQVSYPGYCGLVAVTNNILGVGLTGLMVGQCLLGGIAIALVVRFARQRWGLAGAVIAAAPLATPEWLGYHHALYTESVYVSCLAIAVATGGLGLDESRRWLWLTGVAGVAAASMRPNGWFALVAIAVFVAYAATKSLRLSAVVAAVFAIVAVVAPPAVASSRNENISGRFAAGEVLWNVNGSRVAMPHADVRQGLAGVAVYAAEHPLDAARLMAARVGAELAHSRDIYSATRNWMSMTFLAALYVLMIVGVQRMDPVKWLAFGLIVIHLGGVAVSFADPWGRSLLWFLPMIGLLAGAGMADLLEAGRQQRVQEGISVAGIVT